MMREFMTPLLVLCFILMSSGCKESTEIELNLTLRIEVTGNGGGEVDGSADAGKSIYVSDLSQSREYTFTQKTMVTLTADPDNDATFTGWTGDVPSTKNTITFMLDRNMTVRAGFLDKNKQYCTLSIIKTGTGTGNVTSSTGEIDCGSTCSALFEKGSTVLVSATPGAGSSFSGWSGAGSGINPILQLTMDTSKILRAAFHDTSIPQYTLSVTKSGEGLISSNPTGIDCGAACTALFEKDVSVTLSAVPANGYDFVRWEGDHSDVAQQTTISMTRNTSLRAIFTKIPTYNLRVTKTGQGRISSSPAGINCGFLCEEDFRQGSVVELHASPDIGWSFSRWEGQTWAADTICGVEMTGGKTVNAVFTELPPLVYEHFDTEPNANGWTYGPGSTADATYKISQSFIRPNSMGLGSGWHGPEIMKPIPRQLNMVSDNFTMEFYLVNPTNYNYYNKIEFGLYSADFREILSILYDTNYGRMYVVRANGGSAQIFSNSTAPLEGKFTMTKQGSNIFFQFNDGAQTGATTMNDLRSASHVFLRMHTSGNNTFATETKLDWLRVKLIK